MTSVYISDNANPNYIFNTMDIVDGKVAGCNRIGNVAMDIDTGLWYIIKKDLTLATYGLPAVLNGDLNISEVDQGLKGTEAWLVDGSGVIQPISSTQLPVALGTHGALKIEGVASGTVIPVSSDGLTDTQLRASPVPISGTVTANTGGLTDTQIRATPLPVSGNISADTELPTAATLGDTTTNPSTTVVGTMNELYNNSSWDRYRNNYEVTALSSSARTSSTNSADLINYNARGAIIILDITNLTLTGTLTVNITGKDSLSGKYYPILMGASIATTGTTVMTIYPGASITANVSASFPLPRIWRVEVVNGNGVSITYSIGVNYIL